MEVLELKQKECKQFSQSLLYFDRYDETFHVVELLNQQGHTFHTVELLN